MFLLSKPPESRIRAILERQQSEDLSYAEAGASRGQPPAGYVVLNSRVDLGFGPAVFARAVQALRDWKMFDFPGIRLCWPDAPIQAGTAVAIVVQLFGFWSLNFCRIVYVIDDEGPVRRFGFAYGTLREHAEQGEERFTVEWDRASDLVSYDILSFSRPGNAAVKVAHPLARWLQSRFARHSLAAMADAVRTK